MRRKARNERKGAAIVEFAVLLPFLLYMTVIAVDWARLMYFSQCVNDCARAGVMWAADAEVRMKSRYKTVTDAALAESPGLQPTPTVNLTNGVDPDNYPMVTVTVRMRFDTISNFPGVPKSQTITRTVWMRVAPMISL